MFVSGDRSGSGRKQGLFEPRFCARKQTAKVLIVQTHTDLRISSLHMTIHSTAYNRNARPLSRLKHLEAVRNGVP